MTDPLSDDARLALAFIRDHPGQTFEEIDRKLPIGTERLWYAMKQLSKQMQIVHRNRPYRYAEKTSIPEAIVFYPAWLPISSFSDAKGGKEPYTFLEIFLFHLGIVLL